MLALPLSIPFALISLVVLGETLNIYSILGLFLLFGIVKKNGILQVDYTNTLRATGMPRDQAILEANAARLRPILMTSITLIAAMVPIALGKGPGAASRASLAKVIIGGRRCRCCSPWSSRPWRTRFSTTWESLPLPLLPRAVRAGRGPVLAVREAETPSARGVISRPSSRPQIDEPVSE